jgi:hypothetical protein
MCCHTTCLSCLNQLKKQANYKCSHCREIILSEKPNFALIDLIQANNITLPTNNNSSVIPIKIETKRLVNFEWKVNEANLYFRNYLDNDSIWYEIENDLIKFKYICLGINNQNEFALYDETRDVFVRISNNKLFFIYGRVNSIDDINNLAYIGEWKVKPF